MKVWITKYALATGVLVADGNLVESNGRRYARVTGFWNLFRLGTEAHKAEADALAQVRKMVLAKERSLKKAMANLEAISLEVARGRLPMAKQKG